MKKNMMLAGLCMAVATTASAVDLDSLSLAIAMRQPAIAASLAETEAEIESEKAENVLEGPEAEFEYKFGPEGNNRWGVSVGQGFDWPGLYHARSRAAGYRRSALRQLHINTLNDKALEVKTAILRYAAAAAVERLYAEAADNFSRLAGIYGKALQRGETTILEVRKIEMQSFDVRLRLDRAVAEKNAAAVAYATIAGEDAAALPVVELEVSTLRPFEEYSQRMLTADPATAYYAGIHVAAKADISVARRAALPSFKLSYIHDFEENMHFNGFGVSVALPSWNPRRSIAAAEAKAIAAENVLGDYKLQASARLYADYALAERLFGTLAEAAPTFVSGDYPALLAKALDAGRISLFDYLTEYYAYLEAQIGYMDILHEYSVTVARLNRYFVLPS